MHRNNFDFLRLVFATFVLITHSYVLTGVPENDFLHQLSNGQINCSSFGVKGFFIISGYLIFQSMLRSKNWFDYMVKRVLRIYPAYLVVLIVAVMASWAVTTYTTKEFFADHSIYVYVFHNMALFLPLQYTIDHTFANNPYHAVNGSLWTIPYEFFFYILLSSLFFIRKQGKLLLSIIIVAFISLFFFTILFEDLPSRHFPKDVFEWHLMAHLGLCFLGGSVLAVIKIEQFRYKLILLISTAIAIIIVTAFHQLYFIQFILLPVLVVLTGAYATAPFDKLNTGIGDFSYGIYLYGFLVQQMVMHYFALDHWQLLMVTIPITYLMGALSWHLIEKRALALKKYFP